MVGPWVLRLLRVRLCRWRFFVGVFFLFLFLFPSCWFQRLGGGGFPPDKRRQPGVNKIFFGSFGRLVLGGDMPGLFFSISRGLQTLRGAITMFWRSEKFDAKWPNLCPLHGFGVGKSFLLIFIPINSGMPGPLRKGGGVLFEAKQPILEGAGRQKVILFSSFFCPHYMVGGCLFCSHHARPFYFRKNFAFGGPQKQSASSVFYCGPWWSLKSFFPSFLLNFSIGGSILTCGIRKWHEAFSFFPFPAWICRFHSVGDGVACFCLIVFC